MRNIRRIYDPALDDDTSLSWTVPAGEVWEILAIWVNLVTSAVVGNRLIVVEGDNPAGYVSWRCPSVTNVAAGATARILFAPDSHPQAAAPAPGYTVALPSPCLLWPGCTLLVWDWNVIDDGAGAAGHDDMLVGILVDVHEA